MFFSSSKNVKIVFKIMNQVINKETINFTIMCFFMYKRIFEAVNRSKKFHSSSVIGKYFFLFKIGCTYDTEHEASKKKPKQIKHFFSINV